MNYAKGTTLEVRRIGCRHLGIATGDGKAIHNSKKEKRVVESSLSEFADGEQIEVNDKITSENMPLACERARLLKGDAYDVILNNCEHLVHYVHGKGKKSPQLQRAAIVVGGAWVVTDKRVPSEFKRAAEGAVIGSLIDSENPTRGAAVGALLAVIISKL